MLAEIRTTILRIKFCCSFYIYIYLILLSSIYIHIYIYVFVDDFQTGDNDVLAKKLDGVGGGIMPSPSMAVHLLFSVTSGTNVCGVRSDQSLNLASKRFALIKIYVLVSTTIAV